MKDEQLQMILNALLTIGADGKEAFIWWLAMDKGLSVFGWLATFAGMMWVAKRLIDVFSINSMFSELRDALGVGSYGHVTPREAKETLERAIALARKAKNENT